MVHPPRGSCRDGRLRVSDASVLLHRLITDMVVDGADDVVVEVDIEGEPPL